MGIEGVADDLLRLEFHTGDAENCRHMWELRREALLPVFCVLYREINTTLVLHVTGFPFSKLQLVSSRTVRGDDSFKSTDMKNICSAFAEMVSRQHAAPQESPL